MEPPRLRPNPSAPDAPVTPGDASPRQSSRRGGGSAAGPPGLVARRVPVALAAAVVGLQIAYPLVSPGPARDQLTIATVLVFFAASAAHAAIWRGVPFAAALVALTGGGGFGIEALGVATGLPFGAYTYAPTLGPALLDVPLIIPLAWTMMAYPAYVVACRLASTPWVRVPLAGWALTSWDLFLDPQMVEAGHWSWHAGGPAVLGIPLSNFAGWLLVATAMMAALDAVAATAESRAGGRIRRVVAGDAAPVALYLWVYGSSVLSHAAFFGLPGSAVLGGIGMGAVAIPLTLRLATDARGHEGARR